MAQLSASQLANIEKWIKDMQNTIRLLLADVLNFLSPRFLVINRRNLPQAIIKSSFNIQQRWELLLSTSAKLKKLLEDNGLNQKQVEFIMFDANLTLKQVEATVNPQIFYGALTNRLDYVIKAIIKEDIPIITNWLRNLPKLIAKV